MIHARIELIGCSEGGDEDRDEAEDLVDVAYSLTDSPIGPLLVAATPARASGKPYPFAM